MSKGNASQTPVMRQYAAAKAANPDALLLFRMGDFYELFFDDAVVAARALDLTLTARNKGSDDEVPMAGVPHHAASAYVQRLLEQGFKVAICEQMADPSKVKGLVPREVVRVVTPGVAYDDAGLEARQNHYLAAVEGGGGPAFGVAAIDLSTGELIACEASDAASALSEIVRLDPREILVGPDAGDLRAPLREARDARPRSIVSRDATEPMTDADAVAILDAQLGAGEAVASCPSRAAAAPRGGEVPGRRARVRGRQARPRRPPRLLLARRDPPARRRDAGAPRARALRRGRRTRVAAPGRSTRRRRPRGAPPSQAPHLAPLASVAAIRRRHDAASSSSPVTRGCGESSVTA